MSFTPEEWREIKGLPPEDPSTQKDESKGLFDRAFDTVSQLYNTNAASYNQIDLRDRRIELERQAKEGFINEDAYNKANEEYRNVQNQEAYENKRFQENYNNLGPGFSQDYLTQFGGSIKGLVQTQKTRLAIDAAAGLGGLVVGGPAGAVASVAAADNIATGAGGAYAGYKEASDNANQARDDVAKEGGSFEQQEAAYNDALIHNIPYTMLENIVSSMATKGVFKIPVEAIGKKLAPEALQSIVKAGAKKMNMDIPKAIATYATEKGASPFVAKGLGIGATAIGNAGQEAFTEVQQDRVTDRAVNDQRQSYNPNKFVDPEEYSLTGYNYGSPEAIRTMKVAGFMGGLFGGVGGYTNMRGLDYDGVQFGNDMSKISVDPEKLKNLQTYMAPRLGITREEAQSMDVAETAQAYRTLRGNDLGGTDEAYILARNNFINNVAEGDNIQQGINITSDASENYFNSREEDVGGALVTKAQRAQREADIFQEHEPSSAGTAQSKAKVNKSKVTDSQNNSVESLNAENEQKQAEINGAQPEQSPQSDIKIRAKGEAFAPKATRPVEGNPIESPMPKQLGTARLIGEHPTDVDTYIYQEANGEEIYVHDNLNDEYDVSRPNSNSTTVYTGLDQVAVAIENGEDFSQQIAGEVTEEEQKEASKVVSFDEGEKLFKDAKGKGADGSLITNADDLYNYYEKYKGTSAGITPEMYMEIGEALIRNKGRANLSLSLDTLATTKNAQGKDVRVTGWAQVEQDGLTKSLVHLYAGADVATAIHEFGHVGWAEMSTQDKMTFAKYAIKSELRFCQTALGDTTITAEQLLNPTQEMSDKIKSMGTITQTLNLLRGDVTSAQPGSTQFQAMQTAVEERFCHEFSLWYMDGYSNAAAPRNIIQRLLDRICHSMSNSLNLIGFTAKELKSPGYKKLGLGRTPLAIFENNVHGEQVQNTTQTVSQERPIETQQGAIQEPVSQPTIISDSVANQENQFLGNVKPIPERVPILNITKKEPQLTGLQRRKQAQDIKLRNKGILSDLRAQSDNEFKNSIPKIIADTGNDPKVKAILGAEAKRRGIVLGEGFQGMEEEKNLPTIRKESLPKTTDSNPAYEEVQFKANRAAQEEIARSLTKVDNSETRKLVRMVSAIANKFKGNPHSLKVFLNKEKERINKSNYTQKEKERRTKIIDLAEELSRSYVENDGVILPPYTSKQRASDIYTAEALAKIVRREIKPLSDEALREAIPRILEETNNGEPTKQVLVEELRSRGMAVGESFTSRSANENLPAHPRMDERPIIPPAMNKPKPLLLPMRPDNRTPSPKQSYAKGVLAKATDEQLERLSKSTKNPKNLDKVLGEINRRKKENNAPKKEIKEDTEQVQKGKKQYLQNQLTIEKSVVQLEEKKIVKPKKMKKYSSGWSIWQNANGEYEAYRPEESPLDMSSPDWTDANIKSVDEWVRGTIEDEKAEAKAAKEMDKAKAKEGRNATVDKGRAEDIRGTQREVQGRQNVTKTDRARSKGKETGLEPTPLGLRNVREIFGAKLKKLFAPLKLNKDIVLKDSRKHNDYFSSHLDEAIHSNLYGGYVSPHSAKELTDNKTLTMITENGKSGIAIEKDGNITGVFSYGENQGKGAVDVLLLAARAKGGIKMDCYGRALVNMYERAGFIPVARILYNGKYVDASKPYNTMLVKNEPDVYVMMATNESLEEVTRRMGKGEYHISSQEELDNLKTFGKNDYDASLEYRDKLLKEQSENKTTPKETVKPPRKKAYASHANIEAQYDDIVTSKQVSKIIAQSPKVSKLLTNEKYNIDLDEDTNEIWDDKKKELLFGDSMFKTPALKDMTMAQIKDKLMDAADAFKEGEIAIGRKELELINAELVRRENRNADSSPKFSEQSSDITIDDINNAYKEYEKKSGATKAKIIKAIEKKFRVRFIGESKNLGDRYENYIKTTAELIDSNKSQSEIARKINEKFNVVIDNRGELWEGAGLNEENKNNDEMETNNRTRTSSNGDSSAKNKFKVRRSSQTDVLTERYKNNNRRRNVRILDKTGRSTSPDIKKLAGRKVIPIANGKYNLDQASSSLLDKNGAEQHVFTGTPKSGYSKFERKGSTISEQSRIGNSMFCSVSRPLAENYARSKEKAKLSGIENAKPVVDVKEPFSGKTNLAGVYEGTVSAENVVVIDYEGQYATDYGDRRISDGKKAYYDPKYVVLKGNRQVVGDLNVPLFFDTKQEAFQYVKNNNIKNAHIVRDSNTYTLSTDDLLEKVYKADPTVDCVVFTNIKDPYTYTEDAKNIITDIVVVKDSKQFNSIDNVGSYNDQNFHLSTQSADDGKINTKGVEQERPDTFRVTFTKSAQNSSVNQEKIKKYRAAIGDWDESQPGDGSISFTRKVLGRNHTKEITYSGMNGKEVRTTKQKVKDVLHHYVVDKVVEYMFNDKHFLYKVARDNGAINAYMEMMVHKDQASAALSAIESGITKTDGTRTSALMDIVDKIGTEDQWDFLEYCEAYRVLDLANRKKAVYQKMTVDEAEKIIADTKAGPKGKLFEEQRKAFVDYNHALFHTLVDGGMMSEKDYKTYLEVDPNFIPLEKNMTTEDSIQRILGYGKSFVNIKSPIHKIKGSQREIVNPFGVMQDRTIEYYSKSSLNKAAQVFVNDIAKAKTINDKGEEVRTNGGLCREIKKWSVPKTEREMQNKHIFTVMEDGKTKYYQTSDGDVYRALRSFSPSDMSFLSKIMATPAKLVRNFAVIVPDFAIRNVVRDNGEAFLTSEHGFLPAIDSAWGMFQIKRNTKWWQEYQALNGEMLTRTRDEKSIVTSNRSRKFADLYKAFISNKSSSKQKAILFKKMLEFPFMKFLVNPLEEFNNYAELGTRVGEYKNARMGYKGLAGRLGSSEYWGADIGKAKNNQYIAAYKAKDITLNYGQHGIWGKELNKYIPFFNATLQGSYKILKALDDVAFNSKGTRRRVELGFKMAATVMLASAVFGAGHGDPDYDDAPDYEWQRFWILPNGIRIPKDQVFGTLIGTTYEMYLRQMAKDGKADVMKLVKNAIGAGTPDTIIPSMLTWMIGILGNHDTFTDKDIVPYFQKDKVGWTTADITTSNFADDVSKFLYDVSGKRIDISPKKIDWFTKSTFSNTAKYANAFYDITLGRDKPEKMARGSEPGDEWVGSLRDDVPKPLNQIAGTLTTNRTSYQSISDFYEDYKNIKKHVDAGEIKKTDREWKKYEQADKRMMAFNKTLKQIKNDKKLSAKDKRAKADPIFKKQVQLAKWAKGVK